MSKIIKKVNHEVLKKTAKRCRERGIKIPTFQQLRDPRTIPDELKKKLAGVDLWDVNPINLFRISWKNNIKTGLYGNVNFLEIPKAVTGVKARIIGLVGKYFPTGAHKVGAAFGCLVPRLVSGEFDPSTHKAVWPSTGNFCRGGAFDCALLDCTAVAILPEGMSKERFDWLKKIGAEVIATPGSESNVKEIYDKCWELKKDTQNVIFNQFEEFGNSMFHYTVTGAAIEEAFKMLRSSSASLSAFVSATGSAGTIAAGDYLKKQNPDIKIIAAEALQCPTMLMNGFGSHRIEGIGDKHIPWIHNVRNTDAVTAIDDEDCMKLLRLFNEEPGLRYLVSEGVSDKECTSFSLLGISSICNLLASIKTAKFYNLNEDDIIFTIFTDSVELYKSRLHELDIERGRYLPADASADFAGCLTHQGIDFYKDLKYYDRRTIHNLKYYTWVEQQGRTLEDLEQLWEPHFWTEMFQTEPLYFDKLITEFNNEIG
jgi:cysteine synthase